MTDIRKGDRVRWKNTEQRGTVRSVSVAIVLVEWEDGKVRGYDLPANDLHRIYVSPTRILEERGWTPAQVERLERGEDPQRLPD